MIDTIAEYEKFGASLLSRRQIIKERTAAISNTQNLDFGGKLVSCPVFDVSIKMPVYRLANGRTKTYQKAYLANNPNLPIDFFTADTDSVDAQRAQHEILKQLIDDQELLKAFKDTSKIQTEPLLCTVDGVVVNGNRRLCTWRELYYSNEEKYKHFKTVTIMILPPCDEEQIEELELQLQVRKTHRAEYKWHTIAMMAKEEIKKGKKLNKVAQSFGMTSANLSLYIEAMDFAAAYLQSIGKKDQWPEVDKSYHAFEQYAKSQKKLNKAGDLELFQALSYACIKNGSSDGRLYDVIPNIATNIGIIADRLFDRLDIQVPEADPLAELLGGGSTFDKTASLAAKVEQMNSNGQQDEIVHHTQVILDDIKQEKNEQKSRTYLIERLQKAASILKQIVTDGIDLSQTDINGVDRQLANIENAVKTIKGIVGDHDASVN